MIRRLAMLAALSLALSSIVFAGEIRLPTGVFLDPVAPAHRLGNFPLAIAVAPEGNRAVVLLSGWREHGIEVIDLKSGEVVQKIAQPAAFIGLAFSPDGKSLYASGGNEDTIVRYRWIDGKAVPDGEIHLAAKKPDTPGTRYAAGIAPSRDGRFLYVAENLGDALAVVDLATGKVIQRMRTDRYPYGVAVAKNGEVFVSAWGDDSVISFVPDERGLLDRHRRTEVVRHPAALLVDDEGGRLYVASPSTDRIAVIDIATGDVLKVLSDRAPSGPSEGVTPNALAMSPDGSRLYVAEADANAVGVFALSAATSGCRDARGDDSLVGRIPVEWYPAALATANERLLVVNAKGNGTSPNPDLVQSDKDIPDDSTDYTLGQLHGSLITIPMAIGGDELAAFSKRVTMANGWNPERTAAAYPPFRHVIYIIKENRTYDQVFGDVAEGDGDPTLLFFGRDVTPNHHALAKRFGLFDRFFVNAEVSAQGHNWSTAAYSTDYVEKTVPSEYSERGREYDYEGTNRWQFVDEDDDVAAPAMGYIWDAAIRKGVTVRDYGEFVWNSMDEPADSPDKWKVTRRALIGRVNTQFPPYDLDISDQTRVDVWMKDFENFVETGEMPGLQIVRLPNDHTSAGTPGRPTPQAYVADNDLGLGRIVEAVSKSRFWKDTVIFVLEDDAQDGPDHVDSHRAPMLVISAWNRGGVFHRFANTTDILATIEEILGLDALSTFDFHGRPLREIFASKPDLRPYAAEKPAIDMDAKNPKKTWAAKESAKLDLRRDAADEDAFNRILWKMIKGDAPYPGPTRQPAGLAWSR